MECEPGHVEYENWVNVYLGEMWVAYAMVEDCSAYVALALMAVDPEFRGRGIATLLLKKVLDLYRTRDIRLIIAPFIPLDWDEKRQGLTSEQLTAWYARHDFQSVGNGEMVLTRLPPIRSPRS